MESKERVLGVGVIDGSEIRDFFDQVNRRIGEALASNLADELEAQVQDPSRCWVVDGVALTESEDPDVAGNGRHVVMPFRARNLALLYHGERMDLRGSLWFPLLTAGTLAASLMHLTEHLGPTDKAIFMDAYSTTRKRFESCDGQADDQPSDDHVERVNPNWPVDLRTATEAARGSSDGRRLGRCAKCGYYRPCQCPGNLFGDTPTDQPSAQPSDDPVV